MLNKMGNDEFELYKEQKNELIKALEAYDPTIKFKYHKDPKDLAESGGASIKS
jgi:hypothetical protein